MARFVSAVNNEMRKEMCRYDRPNENYLNVRARWGVVSCISHQALPISARGRAVTRLSDNGTDDVEALTKKQLASGLERPPADFPPRGCNEARLLCLVDPRSERETR